MADVGRIIIIIINLKQRKENYMKLLGMGIIWSIAKFHTNIGKFKFIIFFPINLINYE